MLGQKVDIVTPKATRQCIFGIKTCAAAQIIFIETLRLHQPRSLLNEQMVDVAQRCSPSTSGSNADSWYSWPQC